MKLFHAAYAAALLASHASAQVLVAVARSDAPLPGGPPAHVAVSFDHVTVNQTGGYAVSVSTLTSTPPIAVVTHVAGSPSGGEAQWIRGEQNGIAGYHQRTFDRTIGLSDAFALTYSPMLIDMTTGAASIDSLWVDANPLVVDGQAIPSLAGRTYAGVFTSSTTSFGAPYWISGFRDALTGAHEGDGLFFGATQTCVWKTGDAAPWPFTGTILGSSQHLVRYSANAMHRIEVVRTSDPNAATAPLIDGQSTDGFGWLLHEGADVPSFMGGVPGERWSAWTSVDIDDAGRWLVAGRSLNTSVPGPAKNYLLRSGLPVARAGLVVDGLTLTNASYGGAMSQTGQLAFVWGTTTSAQVLFAEGRAIARTGDAVDWNGDGIADLDATLVSFGPALAVGPDATVYVAANVTVGTSSRTGLFKVVAGTLATPYCFGDGSATACPCGNVGATGRGCANSVNPNGARLSAVGLASVSADTFALHGVGMPNATALYFQGSSSIASGLGVPFGDGLRCVGGAIRRLGTRANVGGASTFPASGTPTISAAAGIATPVSRFYQVWYRNPASFCTNAAFNLTNAVSVTWIP